MGALDDAIREHLELKRQHGASDEEIRQAEADALGPARREPAGEAIGIADEAMPPPDPAEGASVQPGYEPPSRDESAGADGDYLITDRPPPPPPPPAGEPDPHLAAAPDAPVVEPHPVEPVHTPVEPAPPAEPVAPVEPISEHAPEPVQEQPPVDESAPAPPPAEPIDPDRQRTAILDDPLEHGPPDDVAHHDPAPPAQPAQGEPPAEEDVLEETPDFLQETPEHDRLWFEQKPPRDFDFDD